MNYKTNKYSKAFTLLELLVAVSVISMMSSVILAAVQNAKDQGRISGGIRFATNAYRGFGDKMVAYFDFNDSGPLIYKDATGAKPLATAASTPTGLPATRQLTSYASSAGSSMNLLRDTPSGTYQYIRFNLTPPTSSYLPISQAAAISVWIRASSDSINDNLLLADSGQNTMMYIPSSGSASNANQLVVSDRSINLVSGFAISDGNWHNITWSSSRTGPEKLYIDGNLVDEEPITGARSVRNIWYFGWNGRAPGTTGALAFQGDVDDFMLFQQDLAESEVKQIYAMGAPSHPVAKVNSSK